MMFALENISEYFYNAGVFWGTPFLFVGLLWVWRKIHNGRKP
jgi:hypothetical protein